MYNEEQDSKKIFENGFTNKQYSFYESVLVAKYFRHILDYGDARVKTALKEFCTKNDRFFIEVPNIRNIKSAVARSRRPFVNKSNPISICQEEIDTIKSVEGYKQRKILFAIFVLSKINNGFINNKDWNNIRRVLHSKITNKNIASLMFSYAEFKLLYPTNYPSHKILFINNDSPAVYFVSSDKINNLKLVFEEIFGKDLFTCLDCNKPHERKSYNQKRCSPCSKIHKKEIWRLQKIRQRKKLSAN